MPELDKAYDPKATEEKIYQRWMDSGYFTPENLPGERKERFSMVLPPPNVTGTLHLGHAVTVTIEDIIIRYQRMLGKKALWLPGTDHASIATETKFLKETKIHRSDYNEKRDEFVNLVNEYALKNQSTIIDQLRSLGASLDWTRLAFTLDEDRKKAVKKAFLDMYNAGLIYAGEYPVNWDVKGQTTVSDDEIEYEQTKGTLYTFKYSKKFPVQIATTRPETKLGDIAVAVHPEGKWKEYIGQNFTENFAGVELEINIIGDNAVDPEFGTGAVGITPAHSKIDYQMALRHGLIQQGEKLKQVINEYGKIDHTTEKLNNLNINQAREQIVQWLKDNKLLEKEETIEHNIAKAQRSGGIIEVLPKRHQFFINVNKPIAGRDNKTLRELMRDVISKNTIKIFPERFKNNYSHWIDNLQDWNISRQIWYGHPIPDAWYKDDEIKISPKSPGEGWNKILDTLDTWFSSGLWTFSTLGWPENTEALKTYHPTDLLETGYDILFFWVAKMILMASFFLGEVPFHAVYLHGLVRDENRRKMSKSLGNVIDPLVMTKKYGTDALRMALIFNTAPGTDSVLSEKKVKGMQHFANKLWNIARFILMSIGESVPGDAEPEKKTDADKDILEKLAQAERRVADGLESFHIHEAAQEIYQFTWYEFADVYLEKSKSQLQDPELKKNTEHVLLYVLGHILKVLHPFMPFVTEEIWDNLPAKDKTLLLVSPWPEVSSSR